MEDLKEEIIKIRLGNPKGYSKIIRSHLEMVNFLNNLYPTLEGHLAEQTFCLVKGFSEPPKCPNCGKKPKFESGAYKVFCSCRCAGLFNVEKNKKTKLERYGDPCYNNLERYKKTSLEKYGRENIFQGPEGAAFARDRYLEKLGVSNPKKLKSVIEKTKETNLKRYGKEVPCNFKKIKVSKGELEVLNFIESFYQGEILHSDRTVIEPLELDIYLPKLNLGIEYDGDYWHSIPEMVKRGLRKNEACKKKGLKLLRIKESQWQNEKELVKEFLKEELQIC